MLDPIPSWPTSDGKIHPSKAAAIRHELTLWFDKAGENIVGARRIVAKLDPAAIDQLGAMLEALALEMTNPSEYRVYEQPAPPLRPLLPPSIRVNPHGQKAIVRRFVDPAVADE